MSTIRNTTQALAPIIRPAGPANHYDLYPAFPLKSGTIRCGYDALAQALAAQPSGMPIILDGFGGILWEDFRARLDAALRKLGETPRWQAVDDALLPEDAFERLAVLFLGGDDPLFGKRFTGDLVSLFDPQRLAELVPACLPGQRDILYGCGAALAGWSGWLVYIDLPKNEVQFRARAGVPVNLGRRIISNPKQVYKRCYFLDWPVLTRHKAALLPRIDLVVDGQRREEPLFIECEDLRQGLSEMSRNYFRVRPWFEPGPWGGQWIKQHIPDLPQGVPNYAWSFELIVPENGLIFEKNGRLLEVSFDLLMAHDSAAVLGDSSAVFDQEFPIRFDYLDTFEGGNLSVQVHPQLDYVREQFGERITQDETYYILDAAPDAGVFLGFREGIDPGTFRRELETSFTKSTPLEIERFVNRFPSHPGDLFLIPNGTIHSSGRNNLVLEISATPYIFTFKMYDWLRMGMDGQPRPLNIARAFENLIFERQGRRAEEELISKPYTLEEGDGWRLIHLPTHPQHFYDVHRFEFDRAVEASTNGSCHVLNLVEGEQIEVITANGMHKDFHYAETFVIPAAAGSYRLVNKSAAPVRVVKAFIKADLSRSGLRKSEG